MCGQSLKLEHFADSIAEDEARAAACLRRFQAHYNRRNLDHDNEKIR
jgi:hypothetical protein